MKKQTYFLPVLFLGLFVLLVSSLSARNGELEEDSVVFLPIMVDISEQLLKDDFRDSNSGWPVDDDGRAKWSYQDGEYEMLVRFPGFWAGALAPVNGLTNYNIRASMRRVQGSTSGLGLVFDWQNWRNFYYLIVNPGEQWFGVAKVVENVPSVVINKTFANDVILPGNATNRLRIDRNGPQIAVSINGKRLATEEDEQFAGPFRAGLYLEANLVAPALARFDNVEIWRLDNGQQQTLTAGLAETHFSESNTALDWDLLD